MQDTLSLSVPMEVFTIFYAIAWGALANALPRWKAFDTGRFFVDDLARRRVLWSVLVLNILPPCYFAFWLAYFGSKPAWQLTEWGGRAFLAVLVPAIAAWTPPFSFYRIWACVVQRWPQCFYPMELDTGDWEKRFPGLSKQENLSRDFAVANLVFAFVYLAVSLILPFAFLCFS